MSGRGVVRVPVARTDELPSGSRRLITAEGRTIGVFSVGGEYFAVLNRCPHQGGPLCEGDTTGIVRPHVPRRGDPTVTWERDGEILRCPWHAWEFDLRTGRAVFGEGWRVRTYPAYAGAEPPGPVETYATSVEDSMVYVEVPRSRAA